MQRRVGIADAANEAWPGLESVCRWITARAAASETAGHGLAAEFQRLTEIGLVQACAPSRFGGAGLGQSPQSAQQTFEVLRRLGRASLPVARIFEGHINAVKLVALYGAHHLQETVFRNDLCRGSILGVWGADGTPPVTYSEGNNQSVVLHGRKSFASGLGLVSQAVVTGKPRGEKAKASLFLADVSQLERQDPSMWKAAGMKATLSGDFDFEGLSIPAGQVLGKPGDYEIEPFFDGGVWRYCAAHIGGAEALIDFTLDVILRRDQQNAPLQLARMADAIAICRAAACLVRKCADLVESADPADASASSAAADALIGRAFVSNMAIRVLEICERCLGTSAHMMTDPAERLRRDLSLYIRQAAPDAKLYNAATQILSRVQDGVSLW